MCSSLKIKLCSSSQLHSDDSAADSLEQEQASVRTPPGGVNVYCSSQRQTFTQENNPNCLKCFTLQLCNESCLGFLFLGCCFFAVMCFALSLI